jgi:hypothetical protein
LQLVCFQALIQTYAFRCVRFPKENEHNGNGSLFIFVEKEVEIAYDSHY